MKAEDVSHLDSSYINSKRINFYITLKPKMTYCPECGSLNIVRKEWKERKVIHKVYDDKDTTVFVKYCRYKCKECLKTFSENNPISLKGQNISMKIVMRALEELISLNATCEMTAKRLGVSPTTISNIIDKYLIVKAKRLPKVMCIDEIYVKRHDARPYACVLLNHKTGKLIDVIKGRGKLNLINYFLSKKQEEILNVNFITMDMWEPYLDVAKRCFPHAIVAIDSFHVMEHFVNALNDVRCREMKKYDKSSIQYYYLKKCKELLNKVDGLSMEKKWNRKVKQYLSEYQMVNNTLDISHDLKIAYNFYHTYQMFNKNATFNNAEEKFDKFLENSNLYMQVFELREVVMMIQHWKPWILNSFIIVDDKRLSNGPMEGVNSRLKKIKKTIGKVDNFARYRKRCMLSINKEIRISYTKDNLVKRSWKKRGEYIKKKSQS